MSRWRGNIRGLVVGGDARIAAAQSSARDEEQIMSLTR